MSAPRTPRLLNPSALPAVDERAEIERGLLAAEPQIAAKYLYDRLGSVLFEAITELPEYYPTRTEAAIFKAHGASMAAAIGGGATLIDLGAGNCAKAAQLFALLEPRRYVAVDISAPYLLDALKRLQRDHPQLDIVGVGQDFSTHLALPQELLQAQRCVFFYPGSSIGNFTPEQACGFLRGVRAQAAHGGLLIGVDLVKDSAVLQAAYDDALGVTAAFNLNVLRQVNRLIGADFEPRDWRHVGRYDAARSRAEMHLQARRAVTVRWPGAQREFAAGERILTEISCKYTRDGFAALLEQAGFAPPTAWSDPLGWFAVYWAAPR